MQPGEAGMVVVASPDPTKLGPVIQDLRARGFAAYATHSMEGCLRVATHTAPRTILLDPVLPERLRTLLRAHPATRYAAVLSLDDAPALGGAARFQIMPGQGLYRVSPSPAARAA